MCGIIQNNTEENYSTLHHPELLMPKKDSTNKESLYELVRVIIIMI